MTPNQMDDVAKKVCRDMVDFIDEKAIERRTYDLHVVRQGETLQSVASLDALTKRGNDGLLPTITKINEIRLAPGQVLKVVDRQRAMQAMSSFLPFIWRKHSDDRFKVSDEDALRNALEEWDEAVTERAISERWFKRHVVQEGETLWSICRRYYGGDKGDRALTFQMSFPS